MESSSDGSPSAAPPIRACAGCRRRVWFVCRRAGGLCQSQGRGSKRGGAGGFSTPPPTPLSPPISRFARRTSSGLDDGGRNGGVGEEIPGSHGPEDPKAPGHARKTHLGHQGKKSAGRGGWPGTRRRPRAPQRAPRQAPDAGSQPWRRSSQGTCTGARSWACSPPTPSWRRYGRGGRRTTIGPPRNATRLYHDRRRAQDELGAGTPGPSRKQRSRGRSHRPRAGPEGQCDLAVLAARVELRRHMGAGDQGHRRRARRQPGPAGARLAQQQDWTAGGGLPRSRAQEEREPEEARSVRHVLSEIDTQMAFDEARPTSRKIQPCANAWMRGGGRWR
ncbi:MAG: hypothetical protein BJ554DRAFT_7853 [Olpidium bornovanus]|uniref:Uncharacterized protein n=1 Tax=Olpidium bornovanus TaxID=278681 RepID=A0A8H7ZV82_9FUNG|nr:MAG: hypothetical protein BJ554DRAFT_7853 [Olpidium bornovanus]